MKIKRSDKQYTDIEKFEEYEFSSCIAYEMAIRHPRVIELIRYDLTKKNKPKDYCMDETHLVFGLPDIYYLDYHFFNDIDHGMKGSMTGWIGNSNKEDDIHIHVLKEYNGFIRNTTYEKNNGDPFYSNDLVRPWFKRPKLWIEKFDGTAMVQLDLNLPVNELMSYVAHLKKSFDENIIKTPYDELMTPTGEQTSLSLWKAYKMADVFFVYDAIKLNYTKRKIQIEVYNYYADKGIETRTLDYKTINKYHEFAIDYIENKRYMEIVTGKKVNDEDIKPNWYL